MLHSYVNGKSGIFWSATSGKQPVYTLFSGNYDAQCIAFATIVWPDMSGHFGWVGDWGSECAGGDQSIATWYCESSGSLSDTVTARLIGLANNI